MKEDSGADDLSEETAADDGARREDEDIFGAWDDFEFEGDEEVENRLNRLLDGLIPDILKRTVASGAQRMSEEGMRSLLRERGLTREAVGFVMGQATALRREILRIVSHEVRFFLENMDLGGELAKILTSISFEIKTEIRFIPNDAAVKPSVRNRVKVKRHDDEADGDEEADGADDDEGGAAEDSEASEAGAPAASGDDKRGKRLWRRRASADEGDEGVGESS